MSVIYYYNSAIVLPFDILMVDIMLHGIMINFESISYLNCTLYYKTFHCFGDQIKNTAI